MQRRNLQQGHLAWVRLGEDQEEWWWNKSWSTSKGWPNAEKSGCQAKGSVGRGPEHTAWETSTFGEYKYAGWRQRRVDRARAHYPGPYLLTVFCCRWRLHWHFPGYLITKVIILKMSDDGIWCAFLEQMIQERQCLQSISLNTPPNWKPRVFEWLQGWHSEF